MKVRVKFAKLGPMKFIGHLDIMRYFQKAMRRADIDIAFSEGFSPHMIMSFAAPLGVGITSSGEYFDMEVKCQESSKEAIEKLNAVMVEGMKVLSYRKVEEGKASKAMSLVAAADYTVTFRPGMEPSVNWKDKLSAFCSQNEINILKKTKRSEKDVNIKPFIYCCEEKGNSLFLRLAAGSVANIKPELVMEAFASYAGFTMEDHALMIHREEIYANQGTEGNPDFISLEDLGEEIE